MEECNPMAFQFFIAQPRDCVSVFPPRAERNGISIFVQSDWRKRIHLFIQTTSLPRRRRMHRYVDVTVRRIVLHVQDVIHAMRDHSASLSGKTQERRDIFLLNLLPRSLRERKYRSAWRSLSPLLSLNAPLQMSPTHVCLRYRLKINLYIGKYRSLLRWLELTFETTFPWRKLDFELYLLRSVSTIRAISSNAPGHSCSLQPQLFHMQSAPNGFHEKYSILYRILYGIL